MARRGDELSEHILYRAKDVFLELGFERASMDAVAARAKTSKRTLYAHFENKERLYLAVIGLVRGLYADKLKSPADYHEDTSEALVRFCGRFLELMLWSPSIAMCRLTMAEAERFPSGSRGFYDAIFTTAHGRAAEFLGERLGLRPKAAMDAAEDLIGRILHPRLTRALFGIDAVTDAWLDDDKLGRDFDLKPIRKTVTTFLRQVG